MGDHILTISFLSHFAATKGFIKFALFKGPDKTVPCCLASEWILSIFLVVFENLLKYLRDI